MNVVNHALSASAKQKPDGNQFGIMKVVHVGVLPPGFRVHAPDSPGHTTKSRRSTGYRFHLDGISLTLLPIASDHGDRKTGAGERTTLFVKDPWIKGRVNRRHVHNFERFHEPIQPNYCGRFVSS